MPTMTTWFGTPGVTGYDSTHLAGPSILRADEHNNIYVLESVSDPDAAGKIRRITPAGAENTVAHASVTGYQKTFAVKGDNDIFVGTQGNQTGRPRVYRVTNGTITGSVAGVHTPGYVDGAAATARFNTSIYGMAVNATGDIMLADFDTPRLRQISAGVVSTLAGSGSVAHIDGTGTAAAFAFIYPDGVFDAAGNYWLLSQLEVGGTPCLRKITRTVVDDEVTWAVTTPLVMTGAAILGGPTAYTITRQAVCAANDGNIYLAVGVSNGQNMIVQFNPTTSAVTIVHQWTASVVGTPGGIVADSLGNLYVSIRFGTVGGNTIHKITGAFTPPSAPTFPPLSSLTDEFATLDTDIWTPAGTTDANNDYLVLGAPGDSGSIETVDTFQLDSAFFKAVIPYGANMIAGIYGAGVDKAEIIVNRDGGNDYLRCGWVFDALTDDNSPGVSYNPITHSWLRIANVPGPPVEVVFSASPNGTSWTELHRVEVLAGADLDTGTFAVAGNELVIVDHFNSAIPPGGPTDPDVIPDPFDPGAIAPPLGTEPNPGGADPGEPPPGQSLPDPTCLSLLELVRQFSAQVKRPVRITGPNTIEMVEVNTPLPTGWAIADAAEIYASTTHELSAGELVLSIDAGLLALNTSADLVTDDIRLLTSDWHMPHQLPVHGAVSGLVRRVSFTATPATFHATVEFRPTPIPFALRRQP